MFSKCSKGYFAKHKQKHMQRFIRHKVCVIHSPRHLQHLFAPSSLSFSTSSLQKRSYAQHQIDDEYAKALNDAQDVDNDPLFKIPKSHWAYVKQYEMDDTVLPSVWMVVRVDGKSFHKFCADHNFIKPVDERVVDLMNQCAIRCMQVYPDILLAYGQSDEYSFVFKKSSILYTRRSSKINSVVASLFASSFVYYWNQFLMRNNETAQPLLYPPAFDSRVVAYPSLSILQDYLNWRQSDCHHNNLYNTAFWNLVQRGNKTQQEAEQILRGTAPGVKNEILFSQFGINYTKQIDAKYRKGTIIVRQAPQQEKAKQDEVAREIKVIHDDFIRTGFWEQYGDQLLMEEEKKQRNNTGKKSKS